MQGVPKKGEKCYHAIRDGCQQLFYISGSARPGAENCEIRGFYAILAEDRLWHLEKSRGWAENGKMQFAGARGTFGEKIWTPQKYLPESAQLYVLADRTPTGG